MTFEIYGTARIIGKDTQRSLFGKKYIFAYEADIDGRKVTGTKKVNFDEYCQTEIGDNTPVKLFSGDGQRITSSRTDAGLESIFGAFVHPSLKE